MSIDSRPQAVSEGLSGKRVEPREQKSGGKKGLQERGETRNRTKVSRDGLSVRGLDGKGTGRDDLMALDSVPGTSCGSDEASTESKGARRKREQKNISLPRATSIDVVLPAKTTRRKFAGKQALTGGSSNGD